MTNTEHKNLTLLGRYFVKISEFISLFITSVKNFISYYAYFIYYYLNLSFNQIFAKSEFDKKVLSVFKFALLEHHKAGQTYADKYPYYYHLKMVASVVANFRHLLKNEKEQLDCLIAAILHDALEDLSKYSYSDYVKMFGVGVADIIYSCTNEKGKTRKDRQNEKFYDELKENRLAVFVKICDRIANMIFSKNSGSSMFNKYKMESVAFKFKLQTDEFKEMFDYIDNI